jgi:hypothetical protein
MGKVMNIIELAKQANGEPARPGGVDWSWGELEAFAALVEAAVRADERKACADLLEHGLIDDENHHIQYAEEIRKRGQA